MRQVNLQAVRAVVISWGFCLTFLPARATAGSPQDAGSTVQLKTEVVPLDIRFGDGKAVLKWGPHNGPVLKNLLLILTQHPLVHMEIEGNPDPWGNASANQELSLKRAESLRDALVKICRVPAGRIQVHPAGETAAARPIASRKGGPVPVYLTLYRLQP